MRSWLNGNKPEDSIKYSAILINGRLVESLTNLNSQSRILIKTGRTVDNKTNLPLVRVDTMIKHNKEWQNEYFRLIPTKQ